MYTSNYSKMIIMCPCLPMFLPAFNADNFDEHVHEHIDDELSTRLDESDDITAWRCMVL